MSKKQNDENSFVFYRSFYDVVNLIPDAAMRCRAYTAICEYGFYGVEPAEDEDVLVKMVFTQAKPQIDANNKRRENGKRGGAPRKTNAEPKGNHAETKAEPMVNQSITETKPNVNENVNANENVNENKNENVNVKQAAVRFTPPTYAQVADYISEKALQIDAAHFMDYYTANGWMVGKNKMQDWKAALRQWNRADSRNRAKGAYNNAPHTKGGYLDGTTERNIKPEFGLCL